MNPAALAVIGGIAAVALHTASPDTSAGLVNGLIATIQGFTNTLNGVRLANQGRAPDNTAPGVLEPVVSAVGGGGPGAQVFVVVAAFAVLAFFWHRQNTGDGPGVGVVAVVGFAVFFAVVALAAPQNSFPGTVNGSGLLW